MDMHESLYLLGVRVGFGWSEREDLNLRHSAPKADALPGCATLRNGWRILYHILGWFVKGVFSTFFKRGRFAAGLLPIPY